MHGAANLETARRGKELALGVDVVPRDEVSEADQWSRQKMQHDASSSMRQVSCAFRALNTYKRISQCKVQIAKCKMKNRRMSLALPATLHFAFCTLHFPVLPSSAKRRRTKKDL